MAIELNEVKFKLQKWQHVGNRKQRPLSKIVFEFLYDAAAPAKMPGNKLATDTDIASLRAFVDFITPALRLGLNTQKQNGL